MTDDPSRPPTTSDPVPDQVPATAEVPTSCETCGTTLETGMVGIAEADIGNTPDLPATTVVEAFCPNADCPAHKPTRPDADLPGSVGGDNGGG